MDGVVANSIWISANDRDSEDDFRQSDGSKQTYTNWKDGEPQNDSEGRPENCVVIKTREHNFEWNDVICTNGNPYVCEKGRLRV